MGRALVPRMYEAVYVVELLSAPPGLLSVVGAALGALGAIHAFRSRYPKSRWRMVLVGVAALALVGFALMGSLAAWRANSRLVEAERSGRCETVEGVVRVLRTEPEAGHTPPELVSVGGKEFCFSYFSVRPGYHATLAHGGVLVDGARVRLCVVGPEIARIELMRRE